MVPRGALDIAASSLVRTLARSCASSAQSGELHASIRRLWNPAKSALVTSSMRSGLECVLTALRWPAGTEVLVSAVTIPHVIQILEEHGLVPVPLDVPAGTLSPNPAQVQERISSRTRALLIAHLFGSRVDLSIYAATAQERNVQLWEDVAQGFAADDHRGDQLADISFFSFGTIKHQTAAGGGIVQFRDDELAAACTTIQASWPQQPLRTYRQRLMRCLVLSLLAQRPISGWTYRIARAMQLDIDRRLSDATRGYLPSELGVQLRQRPCLPLLQLLAERLEFPDRRLIRAKCQLAAEYEAALDSRVLIGREARFACRWVFPIVSSNRERLRDALWHGGFDATFAASRLKVVHPHRTRAQWSAPAASAWLQRTIFLPLHPKMSLEEVQEISAIVNNCEARSPNDVQPLIAVSQAS